MPPFNLPVVKIELVAEDALFLRFESDSGDTQGAEARKNLAQTIGLIRAQLLEAFPNSFVELIPSFSSLLMIVDFPQIEPQKLLLEIKSLLEAESNRFNNLDPKDKRKIIEIPVYYGDEVALDLKALSQSLSLAPEKIIQLHQAEEYTVCALGFSPGFAYLGFVDERIACTRKSTPRSSVAKGSVGIADQQTGIYPMQSPGGWNIIGRSNFSLFNPSAQASKLCPLQVGDRVRFVGIDRQSFLEQGGSFED